MIDDYYDNMAKQQTWLEYAEKEMHKTRKKALDKLSKIVHPEMAEDFAKMLAYGWRENLTESEKIARELGLGHKDFCAIELNLEAYENIMLDERCEYA